MLASGLGTLWQHEFKTRQRTPESIHDAQSLEFQVLHHSLDTVGTPTISQRPIRTQHTATSRSDPITHTLTAKLLLSSHPHISPSPQNLHPRPLLLPPIPPPLTHNIPQPPIPPTRVLILLFHTSICLHRRYIYPWFQHMYFFLRPLNISDKVILANESVLTAQRVRGKGPTPAHAQAVEVLEDVGFGILPVEELVVGKGVE
jgi:hypothetical protein